MGKINSEILSRRFLDFGLKCQELSLQLSKELHNEIYAKQLIRSSSSPGANYIEAIEASSRKEFILKLKICKRETKEAIYWLTLIQNTNSGDSNLEKQSEMLIKEAQEFLRIFASSVLTAERNLASKGK